MGLWTKGDSVGPWSMVDQAPYPFGGSNMDRSMLIQWLREEEAGAAVGIGGVTAGDSPEWCSNGQSPTVNGLGGGGRDGEPIFAGGLARQGRSRAHDGERWMAALGASGGG
jgi:hypothetical protein